MIATPAFAGLDLNVPAAVQPGALIIGQTSPGTTVRVDGKPVRVSQNGYFLAAVGRDDTGERLIQAVDDTGAMTERRVAILERDYNVQRIDGLPQKTVTPDPETAEKIGMELAAIRDVRKLDTASEDFAAGFVWPLNGRVTGVYGSQRILNGNPRRPHFGIDIAAPEGTPIVATASGIVRLADEDMVLTGKTLMIDHGHGLMSIYVHMSEITVEEGQTVAAGETIGAVGQTGRTTGPHLHLGVTLFAEQLDPKLVIGPFPEG